ncbi:hypothetical protein BY458DRAFT_210819 [Sporodiniella umbellata]|nr:hypothetical protein BY458DRAFT_210819 [Sporodiniella umbellata]
MDRRGIPVVATTNATSTPRHLPPIHKKKRPASNFLFASLKNETSLLEAYDSFSNDCFNGSFARNYYSTKNSNIEPIIVESNYSGESFLTQKRKDIKRNPYNSLPSTPQCSPPFPPPPAPITPNNDSSQYHTSSYSPIFSNFFDSYQNPLHDSTGVPPLDHYTCSATKPSTTTTIHELPHTKVTLLNQNCAEIPITTQLDHADSIPKVVLHKATKGQHINTDDILISNGDLPEGLPEKQSLSTDKSSVFPGEAMDCVESVENFLPEKVLSEQSSTAALEKNESSLMAPEKALGEMASAALSTAISEENVKLSEKYLEEVSPPFLSPIALEKYEDSVVLPEKSLNQEGASVNLTKELLEKEVPLNVSTEHGSMDVSTFSLLEHLQEKEPVASIPLGSSLEKETSEAGNIMKKEATSNIILESLPENNTPIAENVMEKGATSPALFEKSIEKEVHLAALLDNLLESETTPLEDILEKNILPPASKENVLKTDVSSLLSKEAVSDGMSELSLEQLDMPTELSQQKEEHLSMLSENVSKTETLTTVSTEVLPEKDTLSPKLSSSLMKQEITPVEDSLISPVAPKETRSGEEEATINSPETLLKEDTVSSVLLKKHVPSKASLDSESIETCQESTEPKTAIAAPVARSESKPQSTVMQTRKRTRQSIKDAEAMEEGQKSPKRQTRASCEHQVTEAMEKCIQEVETGSKRPSRACKDTNDHESINKPIQEDEKDSKRQTRTSRSLKTTEGSELSIQEAEKNPKRITRAQKSIKATDSVEEPIQKVKTSPKKQTKSSQSSKPVESVKELIQEVEESPRRITRASQSAKIVKDVQETIHEVKKSPKKRTKASQSSKVIENVVESEEEEKVTKRRTRSRQNSESAEDTKQAVKESKKGSKKKVAVRQISKASENVKKAVQKNKRSSKKQMAVNRISKTDEDMDECIQEDEENSKKKIDASNSDSTESDTEMATTRVTRSNKKTETKSKPSKATPKKTIKKPTAKMTVKNPKALEEIVVPPKPEEPKTLETPKVKKQPRVLKPPTRSRATRTTIHRAVKAIREVEKESSIIENEQLPSTIDRDVDMADASALEVIESLEKQAIVEAVATGCITEHQTIRDSDGDVSMVDLSTLDSPSALKANESGESIIDILSVDEVKRDLSKEEQETSQKISKVLSEDELMDESLRKDSLKSSGIVIDVLEKPGLGASLSTSAEDLQISQFAESSALQTKEQYKIDLSQKKLEKENTKMCITELENTTFSDKNVEKIPKEFLETDLVVETVSGGSMHEKVQNNTVVLNDLENKKALSLNSKGNQTNSNVNGSVMSDFHTRSESDVNFEETDKTKFGNETVFMESILSDEMPISTIDGSIPMSFTEDIIIADTADHSSQGNNYRMSEETEKQAMNQVENWMMGKPNEYALQALKNEEDQVHKEKVTKSRKVEKNPDADAIATQERNERIQGEIDIINVQFPELKKYYTLLDRAGRGTFSKVYRAHDLLYEKYMPWTLQKKLESSFDGNHHYVAIKLIYGISSPRRVANEISCLADLRLNYILPVT